MSDDTQLELLLDLVRLLRKYGDSAYADLARFLRSDRGVTELLTILDETPNLRSRLSLRKRPVGGRSGKRGAGFKEYLANIKNSDPERGTTISNLHARLLAKEVLPTLSELRHFAQDNGLHPVTVTSRARAIEPLLRELAARPIDELQAIVGRIRPESAPGDRTLEGWTKVILRSREHGRGTGRSYGDQSSRDE